VVARERFYFDNAARRRVDSRLNRNTRLRADRYLNTFVMSATTARSSRRRGGQAGFVASSRAAKLKENRDMNGLIIRDPWIGKILSGVKTWEMRTRPTLQRGRIGLIRKGTGLVVGVAELVDSLPALDLRAFTSSREWHGIPAAMDSEVFKAGWVYPWVLRNVRSLPQSIRAGQKSGQVTWVRLSPTVIADIERHCAPAPEGATCAAG
jgi:hypothetical protein